MKRKVMGIGFGLAVLAGGGVWAGLEHKKEKARVEAAEIKRRADEAAAKDKAELEAAKALAAAEAEREAEAEARKPPRRTSEAPADPVDGPHFMFSHSIHGRVGYEYEKDKRPPLYTQIVCDDGVMQAISFDFGLIPPVYESYDFYKVQPSPEPYDQVCLAIRKEDVSTYKNIPAPSGGEPMPAKDCSEADKAKILSTAGHEKDTIRWCKFRRETDSLGFLQAVTKLNDKCEINSWLVSGDRLHSLGFSYKGEYKIEENTNGPRTCIFPLADGDMPEKRMLEHGGPMSANMIFELGQKTYIILSSDGSEGSTSTLYRLQDKLEEVTSYYNYTTEHDFWRSAGQSEDEPTP